MGKNFKQDLALELELDLMELEAYLDLEDEVFDFGQGEMKNDGEFNLGYEDRYLRIRMQEIRNELNNLRRSKSSEEKVSSRLNKYRRKMITKKKLNKLINKGIWWVGYYDEKARHYKRCYYSGRKGYAKYCSRRKVRHNYNFSLKGNGYRKCFDYWWTVF